MNSNAICERGNAREELYSLLQEGIADTEAGRIEDYETVMSEIWEKL